jgi:hypothetical protein
MASRTVSPPVPESNTPIGAGDPVFFWAKAGINMSTDAKPRTTDLKTDIKKTG